MQSVSLMDAPQGAIFLCRLPERKPGTILPGTLLLDGIQDPGNLGTILRTADALEVPVVLLDGCADTYNPKTVRASMGAGVPHPACQHDEAAGHRRLPGSAYPAAGDRHVCRRC